MPELIKHLRSQLDISPPEFGQDGMLRRSAVALLLRTGDQGLEIFFIERAPHALDPWSGNLAFPGGKVEIMDGTLREAAERETFEEVGIDLQQADHLGFLTEIIGAHLPVRVACYIYQIDGPMPTVVLNNEIADTLWVPIAELTAPERQVQSEVTFAGKTRLVPAIRLRQQGKPVLWGITYRLLQYFFSILSEEPCRQSSPP